jgi:hypothetical protein
MKWMHRREPIFVTQSGRIQELRKHRLPLTSCSQTTGTAARIKKKIPKNTAKLSCPVLSWQGELVSTLWAFPFGPPEDRGGNDHGNQTNPNKECHNWRNYADRIEFHEEAWIHLDNQEKNYGEGQHAHPCPVSASVVIYPDRLHFVLNILSWSDFALFSLSLLASS